MATSIPRRNESPKCSRLPTRAASAKRNSPITPPLGVPEVWVVSPEGRTVEVLYLENGLLRSSHVLAHGMLTAKLFPNVNVDIAGIWPDGSFAR